MVPAMNRATAVYIIMAVVGIAGMWVILALGATLTAPPDMAGKWALMPPGTHFSSSKSGAAGGEAASAETDKAPVMAVEQSGEFFQVSFDEGPMLDLRLKPVGSAVDRSGKPQSQAMELVGGPWKLTLAGMAGGDVLDVTLEGPRQGRWAARRFVRTFAANPGTTGSGTAGGGERQTAGTRE
jgi:hypothetical protein